MLKLIRNLIGFSVIVTGFVVTIGMSLYLLISGIVYLVQNGSTLGVGDIAWEILVIIFRDVISVICGIIIMLIGMLIIKKKKRIKSKSSLGTFSELLEKIKAEEKKKTEEKEDKEE